MQSETTTGHSSRWCSPLQRSGPRVFGSKDDQVKKFTHKQSGGTTVTVTTVGGGDGERRDRVGMRLTGVVSVSAFYFSTVCLESTGHSRNVTVTSPRVRRTCYPGDTVSGGPTSPIFTGRRLTTSSKEDSNSASRTVLKT